jgi:hypothetical protein
VESDTSEGKVVPSLIVETDCGESLIVQAFGKSLLVINQTITRYPRLKLIKFVGRDLSAAPRVGLAGPSVKQVTFFVCATFPSPSQPTLAGSQEPQVETTC